MRGFEQEIEFYCHRVRTYQLTVGAYKPGAIEFNEGGLMGRLRAFAARLRSLLGWTRRDYA